MSLRSSASGCVMLVWMCLLLAYNAHAQNIEDYVKQNTSAIASVQPDFADDSDLNMIGKAIGDAKLVLLGEQDHGDAPTFLAKTRLIKYLHQKKAFDVLAFESDFFGLNQGWEQLPKTDLAIDTFLKKNIFPVWTFCDACDELFYNYIPSTYHTNEALSISGFDNQTILHYARQNLSQQLDSVLRKLDLLVTRQIEYTTRILPLIDSLPAWSLSSVKHDDSLLMLESWLYQIRSELKEKVPDDFWCRTVDNLIAETKEFQSRNGNNYVRDSQMAMNIKWLSEVKYPGKKILVWAANEHIAKWENTIRNGDVKNSKTMGGFLAGDSALKEKMYVLGFTSYQGTAGRIFVKPYPIPKARTNGFSSWVYSGLHYPYAFTDFTLYNQRLSEKASFFMSGFGHQETKAGWTDLFDGVFYIQDMYPCRNTFHSTK